MDIAVEAIRLVVERRGIGRYVRNLLPRLAGLDPDLHFTLYARSRDLLAARRELAELGLGSGRAEVQPVGRLGSAPFDLFWCPWNYAKHLPPRGPIVVTIHDVVPLVFPDRRWRRLLTRRKVERRYRQAAASANLVLTDSEFSRGEVRRCLGIPAERIRVAALGADDFAPGDPATAAAQVRTLGIEGPYLLYVGAVEGRKNLGRLLRAFALVRDRHLVDCRLVVAGPGESRRSLLALLDEIGVHDGVHWVGAAADPVIQALYQAATVFVFPSLYEGFGLPVLEAMASGTPVVTASAASIPEVAGDAALYFDPDNTEDLASQLVRVMTEEPLRQSLIRKGLEQAARFRWINTARATLEAFREASGILTAPVRR